MPNDFADDFATGAALAKTFVSVVIRCHGSLATYFARLHKHCAPARYAGRTELVEDRGRLFTAHPYFEFFN